MYGAFQKNGSKGQVKLTSCQYLRLVCDYQICRSFYSCKKKKKSATKRASDQATAINEGGEEIKI